MHVLHIFQPTAGGVPMLVRLLVRHQAAAHEVTVVAQPELVSTMQEEGAARVVPMQMSRGLSRLDPVAAVRIRRLVMEARPDVIHAHSSKAGFLARVASIGAVPVVYSPQLFSFELREFNASQRWLFYWVERLLARFTAGLMLSYDRERTDAIQRRLASSENSYVVANGVDIEPLLEIPPPGNGPLTVGTYAHLRTQKRVDILLRAVAAARSRAQFDVAIYGDGPERSALEDLARELGVPATFHGPTNGPLEPLSRIDVFVLSSAEEEYPLTPMEAMAAGRPVIATDVGAVRDIIPSPAVGVVVPPLNVDALADAVSELATAPDRRAALSAAGRLEAQRRFGGNRMAAEAVAVYHDVLRRVRARA